GWFPSHRKDFVARPEIAFRLAMAIETPGHVQRFGLGHHRHLVNPTVTGFAADTLAHMDGVIEVDMICEIVDANPGQRLRFAGADPHRFQYLGFGGDLAMTAHAGFGGGHTGVIALFDSAMAVAAVQ